VITRLWSGWTGPQDSRAYEDLLTSIIAPEILARGLPGLHGLDVLRRDASELDPSLGSEFLTVMTFDDWAAVRAFTGGESTASVVPPAARALLSRFDEHARHYERLARFAPP
jgi:hypothetical protein